jgi:Ca-activated chloride channel family protein
VSLPAKAEWFWQDVFLTRDQQGMMFYRQGDYRKAAQRFDDDHWRALALYAAEDFQQAAAVWSRIASAEALFNRGNALAHAEDYFGASDSYQLALQMRPDWPEAQANFELVNALAAKPKALDEFVAPPENSLGADDVTFSDDARRMEKAATVSTESADQSSKEIQALWMDRLQSTPADFLRLKFLHQYHQSSLRQESEQEAKREEPEVDSQ